MTIIIYATTSGSTALVADQMERCIGRGVRLIDLKTFERPDPWRDLAADLVIAGGPTYGMGDWHYLWQSKFDAVAPMLSGARRVALFGLGDARFHGLSFCGGIGKLHDAVAALGIQPIGTTPAEKYRYDSTPSLRDGAFPGFVIDYKQDRRQARAQIEDWLDALSLRKAKVRQRVSA